MTTLLSFQWKVRMATPTLLEALAGQDPTVEVELIPYAVIMTDTVLITTTGGN